MTALVASDLAALLPLVGSSVNSPHSGRCYARAVRNYLAWHRAEKWPRFSRASVQGWKGHMLEAGASSSTINQALSALKSLAREAAERGLLDHLEVATIERIPGVPRRGVRAGNWLDRQTAQRLIDLPNANTLRGLRDRAVLAVLLGCGLRRDEAARVRYEQIQERDGRWVILDLEGKGRRVRSVPLPLWCAEALDAWVSAAGIDSGYLLRAVGKGDKVRRGGSRLSGNAVRDIVTDYAQRLDIRLAPHDLRRTFAALADAGGASLRKIQAALGHASVATTERYLQTITDLREPACDHLGIGKTA